MDGFTISLIGFAAILILAFLRFPLALSMGLVGVIGFGELTNYRAAISNLGRLVLDLGQSYSLSVLPLFILMGLLVDKGGMAQQLYRAAYAFLGDKKGGLAMSTVVACGMFSAISGSSIATAATMSKVAMPEMRRYRYADSLATASIAAGGTLGILIPPSVILVIYGLLTEQSIGKLFMAGFIPGFIGILLYTLAVYFVVTRNPSLGPAGERTAWPQRLIALKDVWTTLALFIFVIGGIYIGLFSATEAAGMGAIASFIIALFKGMRLKGVVESIIDAGKTSAPIMILLITAGMYSRFLSLSDINTIIIDAISSVGMNEFSVLLMMVLIWLVLGMLLDSISIILLTVPLFIHLVPDVNPYAFAIFGILAIEAGLLTPPFGLIVYTVKGVLTGSNDDVSLGTIFKGSIPYWIMMLIIMSLVYLFPELASWPTKFV